MSAASYEALRKEGYALAGGPADLAQRARHYHALFRDSGGRSVFPLIAAHGALWARNYFRQGEWGGMLLSLPYIFTPARRRARLAVMRRFAHDFQIINVNVFAESYAVYSYSKQHGADALLRSKISPDFADALAELHAAMRSGTLFTPAMRERLFLAFFNWEQDNIVGPAVNAAFERCDWGFIKYLARKTRLDFRYFAPGFRVRFDDFSSVEERIGRGLQVFRHAEEVGLDHVERSLSDYRDPSDGWIARFTAALATRCSRAGSVLFS